MEVKTFMRDGIHQEPPTPKRKKRVTKPRVLIALGILALVITGTALAAWLVQAQGNAYGKLGHLTAPSVTSKVDTSLATMPGEGFGFSITVNNPSQKTLKLVSIGARNNTSVTDSDASSCPVSNFLFNGNPPAQWGSTGDVPLATPISIPPGTTDLIVPGSAFGPNQVNEFILDANAPTGCQDQIVNFQNLMWTFSS